MSFFSIACRNLTRRRARSLLTAMGIAIGAAAGISVVHLAWGFERTLAEGYQARGADLMVGRVTSQRPMTTPFPASMARELEQLPEVEATAGVLGDLLTIEDAPLILVLGWEPRTFLWNHLTLVQGAWPVGAERAVALGTIAADVLGKTVGDTLHIDTVQFGVSGIFASPALVESGAVIMPLPQIQALGGRDGLVSVINLQVRPGAGPGAIDRIRQTVRGKFPGFTAATGSEAVRRNVAIRMGKAVGLATSLVALVLGAVGAMNTMLMSVNERAREMAVLLAVGWRRSRIVRLILIESVVLSVVGGVVGAGLGAAILRGLSWVTFFRGKVDTSVYMPLVLFVIAATVGVGVLSGLYPASVAARTLPAEGLRQE